MTTTGQAIRDRIVELRRVPAGELLRNPKNWRRHPPSQKAALRGVLSDIGFAGALLAYETPQGLRLIDGHLRADIAKDQPVPVLVLDVTEADAAKLLATFDPLSAMAQPDQDKLMTLLQETQFQSADVNAMLEALANGERHPMPDLSKGGLTDSDDVPPAATESYVRRGDIWQLGEHRAMCGDSTKAEDVAALMDGKKADMIFMDPPYAVGLGKKNRALNAVGPSNRIEEDIVGDNLSVEETAENIWRPVFKNAFDNTVDKCCYYMTMPQGGDQMMMMMMMMNEHWDVKHELIWIKDQPTFSIGRLDYDYQHEPILYGWKKGKTHNFYGDGSQKSIWSIPRPRASKLHPTMKPVELVIIAITNSSKLKNSVLDPFLGSGTTVIACEKLGRICYGMEIEPRYVQVAIERWQNFTGEKAVKT